MYLDLEFASGQNVLKFEKKPCTSGDFAEIEPFKLFELNASSYTVFCGLSENLNVFGIGQSALKL